MALARYKGRSVETFQVGQRCLVTNRKQFDREGTIVGVWRHLVLIKFDDGCTREYPAKQVSYLPSEQEIKAACEQFRAKRPETPDPPIELVTLGLDRHRNHGFLTTR